MSMPRRAMEQMGFSICCLTCDAPDVTGSSRCRSCIAAHTRARDRMSGQATSKADRLSRELVTMLASPAKYIDDTEHGELMLHYVTLISQHQGTVSAKTQEEGRGDVQETEKAQEGVPAGQEEAEVVLVGDQAAAR